MTYRIAFYVGTIDEAVSKARDLIRGDLMAKFKINIGVTYSKKLLEKEVEFLKVRNSFRRYGYT